MACGESCIKYLVFLFNLLFAVSVLISISIWNICNWLLITLYVDYWISDSNGRCCNWIVLPSLCQFRGLQFLVGTHFTDRRRSGGVHHFVLRMLWCAEGEQLHGAVGKILFSRNQYNLQLFNTSFRTLQIVLCFVKLFKSNHETNIIKLVNTKQF